MAAVTIYSDFGAPKNKVSHCFHRFPIYFPWSDGTRCHDLHFLNVVFLTNFSLSSFTFIKRLFSSSSLIHYKQYVEYNPNFVKGKTRCVHRYEVIFPPVQYFNHHLYLCLVCLNIFFQVLLFLNFFHCPNPTNSNQASTSAILYLVSSGWPLTFSSLVVWKAESKAQSCTPPHINPLAVLLQTDSELCYVTHFVRWIKNKLGAGQLGESVYILPPLFICQYWARVHAGILGR